MGDRVMAPCDHGDGMTAKRPSLPPLEGSQIPSHLGSQIPSHLGSPSLSPYHPSPLTRVSTPS